MYFKTSVILGAAILAAIPGCTENGAPAAAAPPTPPPLTTEPIGQQMSRVEPRLAGMPFRVLLDFERQTDTVFLSPQSAGQRSTDRAHTGAASLQCGPTANFDVKLASLVSGAFPANWTLAGAYFASAKSATVTLVYSTGGGAPPLLQRTVHLPANNHWTPVFLDLTQLPATSTSTADAGVLSVSIAGEQPVFCDDLTLVNNTRTLDTPDDPASGWTIKQGGYTVDVQRPGRFRIQLKTPEAVDDGWDTREANDLRARFVSTSGKTWTIYSDGRQYQDGQFSALFDLGQATPLFAQQNASPAEIVVPEEYGRIDRDTPGDQNNDGYNERWGSYQLVARGPRFEVLLKPTTRVLVRPVLEISGLPQGHALITVEGQLIEKSIRLPSGNLLLEIPMALERPTTVNITVK